MTSDGLLRLARVHPVTRAEILQIVAEKCGVKVKDLIAKNRRREMVAIRAAFSVVCRNNGFSFPQIGRSLDLDHTSVINAVKRYPELCRHVDFLASKFVEISAAVDDLKLSRMAERDGLKPEPVRA